jgi:hypothetical protein
MDLCGITRYIRRDINSIIDKSRAALPGRYPGQQEELRDRMEAFSRLYSFLPQVIPFGDSKLEKLDASLRFFTRGRQM